jgi:branched-chain amino acid transport system permease protein
VSVLPRSRPALAALLALALLLVCVPFFLAEYQVSLVQKILIFALFAVSLDLVYGYAGLPSLGQAAYFGVGGYAAAVLSIKLGVESFWIILPAGALVGAVIAALFAPIALRTSGAYFLLITFALGQLLATAAIEWSWLHNAGIEGLIGVEWPQLGFGFEWDAQSIYYAVLAITVIGVAVALWVTHSPLGHAARGIREDEGRMRVLGYNTWLCKYLIFIISGTLAALAGQMFAFTSGAVVPANFDITYSAVVFLMVLMGGAGRIYGAAIGAAAYVLLEYYISEATPERWPLFLGAVFIVTALFSRSGVVGLAERALAWLRAQRAGRAARA